MTIIRRFATVHDTEVHVACRPYYGHIVRVVVGSAAECFSVADAKRLADDIHCAAMEAERLEAEREVTT